MKPCLVIDEDSPPALASAVQKLRPGWQATSVRDRRWLGLKDAMLLEVLNAEGAALVSRDRSTMNDWLAERAALGEDHAGVLFWDLEHWQTGQGAVAIGSLARSVVRTVERFDGDLRNVVATVS